MVEQSSFLLLRRLVSIHRSQRDRRLGWPGRIWNRVHATAGASSSCPAMRLSKRHSENKMRISILCPTITVRNIPDTKTDSHNDYLWWTHATKTLCKMSLGKIELGQEHNLWKWSFLLIFNVVSSLGYSFSLTDKKYRKTNLQKSKR